MARFELRTMDLSPPDGRVEYAIYDTGIAEYVRTAWGQPREHVLGGHVQDDIRAQPPWAGKQQRAEDYRAALEADPDGPA